MAHQIPFFKNLSNFGVLRFLLEHRNNSFSQDQKGIYPIFPVLHVIYLADPKIAVL